MARKKMLLLLFLIVFLYGCSSNDSRSSENVADYDYAGGAPEVAPQNGEAELGVSGDDAKKQLANVNSSDRMVIYNAHLSLEVKDYHKVEAEIQGKVAQLQGYVVESSIYFSGEERIDGNLVVKVPQKHFQSFINEMESKSIKVRERQISGNDVTEEYVDLESRLKAKRAVEERLLAFMKDAKATEDLLKISTDLAKVQEEIEQIVGRMKYLETNVEFSTITIYLSERIVNVPPIADKQSLNTWMKAKSLFMDSVNGLISFFSSFIVITIGLSPIIIPIFLVVIGLIYAMKKRKRKPPLQG